MRSRAWMFCSAMFSAGRPPCTRKRGVKAVTAPKNATMADTTASMLTLRWLAPISSASSRERARVSLDEFCDNRGGRRRGGVDPRQASPRQSAHPSSKIPRPQALAVVGGPPPPLSKTLPPNHAHQHACTHLGAQEHGEEDAAGQVPGFGGHLLRRVPRDPTQVLSLIHI